MHFDGSKMRTGLGAGIGRADIGAGGSVPVGFGNGAALRCCGTAGGAGGSGGAGGGVGGNGRGAPGDQRHGDAGAVTWIDDHHASVDIYLNHKDIYCRHDEALGGNRR